MLIISKFHDFYDHVSQAGVDKNVVLQRKSEVLGFIEGLPYKTKKLVSVYDKPKDKKDTNYRTFYLDYLYFCGKVYPKIMSNRVKDGVIFDVQTYTLEEFEKVIPADSGYYRKHWSTDQTLQQQTKDILSKGIIDVRTDVFRTLKVPYFGFITKYEPNRYGHRESEGIQLYPVLKDYTSYLNMDAYTVYQEIEMYCSGVLGVGEPNTIEVSDISKRDSKGFDKFSFKHRK